MSRWRTWTLVASVSAAIAVLGTFASGSAAPQSIGPSPFPFPTAWTGTSRAARPERTPRLIGSFQTYDLRGDPYQRGLEHGQVFSEQIRGLLNGYVKPLELAAGERFDSVLDIFERNIPAAYREEMRGIAEGAGVSYRDVLVSNTIMDGMKLSACTVVGVRTRDGEPVIGRNLDYYKGQALADQTVVFNVYGSRGLRFTSVTFPLLIGVYTGMNESGLTLAVLEVYGRDHRTIPEDAVPYGMLYREILENARTVTEALAVLEGRTIVTAQNLLLADQDDVVIVELDQGSRRLVRPDESPNGACVFAINNFRDQDAFAQDGRFRVYERRRGALLAPTDIERFLRETALKDMNVQSLVMFPRRRAFRLATGLPPAAAQPYWDVLLPFTAE